MIMGIEGLPRKILISPLLGLIYVYKYVISPLLPASCRHYPTCSSYAIDALRLHGPWKGGLLAANRIGRCHPWGTSGFDPVPRIIVRRMRLRNYLPGKCRYPACNRLKVH